MLSDWQWSVGQTPLSLTSQFPRISQMQAEAVWRSYVVDALDTATQRINLVVRCGP